MGCFRIALRTVQMHQWQDLASGAGQNLHRHNPTKPMTKPTTKPNEEGFIIPRPNRNRNRVLKELKDALSRAKVLDSAD